MPDYPERIEPLKPIPFTWERHSTVQGVIDLIDHLESVLLIGDSGSGKTNLIDNVIAPYLEGTELSCDNNAAFQRSQKLKVDYMYFSDKPCAQNNKKLVQNLSDLAAKANKKEVLVKLGNKPSYNVIIYAYQRIIREYVREAGLSGFYLIFDHFDLVPDSLQFIREMEKVACYIIAFKDAQPEEYRWYSFAQRAVPVQMPRLTSEEATRFAQRTLQYEKVRCLPKVYEAFINRIRVRQVNNPGDIVHWIRRLKIAVLGFGYRTFTIKDLDHVIPYASPHSIHNHNVIVFIIVAMAILSACHISITDAENLSPIVLGAGWIVILLMWAWNIADRKMRSGRRLYMRSK